MKRTEFLKTIGLAGIASMLPSSPIKAQTKKVGKGGCVLIPTETAGPFPLDLTENTFYFRKDIRETKTGVQLNLKLKILDVENCGDMSNLRVNIWHCDKDGLYSGYDNTMNAGQAGLTYLRGYQITNASGEVEFTTIIPGWYNGRIAHIHFQVYVSSSYSVISQLTFDLDKKNAIYSANPTLYTKGVDPMTLKSDNIFSDGYDYQIATLTPNNNTGGYDGYLEVTIQGNGTVGLGHLEKENAKQFVLGQNFPNPYTTETNIPFKLSKNSNVKIELFDLMGKKISTLLHSNLESGAHNFLFNPENHNLAKQNYIYQIEVNNIDGVFKECKMMTLAR